MTANTADTGIVFYSRSGHSQRVATRVSNELNGTLLELSAPAYAGRIFGSVRAGFDSLTQKHTLGPQSFSSLAHFRRIVLVGPVWTSYPAVPLRALLRSGIDLPQSVSLFLTSGAHSPAEKAFAAGESDMRRPFTATASLPNASEGMPQEDRIIERFITDLQAASTLAAVN